MPYPPAERLFVRARIHLSARSKWRTPEGDRNPDDSGPSTRSAVFDSFVARHIAGLDTRPPGSAARGIGKSHLLQALCAGGRARLPAAYLPHRQVGRGQLAALGRRAQASGRCLCRYPPGRRSRRPRIARRAMWRARSARPTGSRRARAVEHTRSRNRVASGSCCISVPVTLRHAPLRARADGESARTKSPGSSSGSGTSADQSLTSPPVGRPEVPDSDQRQHVQRLQQRLISLDHRAAVRVAPRPEYGDQRAQTIMTHPAPPTST